MKKVIIYIAMSLDGYIADEKGSVGWLSGDGSDVENLGSYPEFIESVDDILLGHKTYQQIITELSPESWPYDGKQTYVLTHKNIDNKPGITFTNTSITNLILELKQAEGENIWICGGASIVKQALSAKLVDEIVVTIIPIILGGGIRLFDSQEDSQKLKLISLRDYNGIVDLTYKLSN